MTDHGAVAGLLDQDEALHLEGAVVFSGRGFMQVLPESIHVIYHWDNAGKFTYQSGSISVKDSTATAMRTFFPFQVSDSSSTATSMGVFSQGRIVHADATEMFVRVALYVPISFFEVRDSTSTRSVAKLPGVRVQDSTGTRLTYLAWDPWGLEVLMDGDTAHLSWDGEEGRIYWVFRTKVGSGKEGHPATWSELPATWSEMPSTWGDQPPVTLGGPGMGAPVAYVQVPECEDGPLPPGEFSWQVFEELVS